MQPLIDFKNYLSYSSSEVKPNIFINSSYISEGLVTIYLVCTYIFCKSDGQRLFSRISRDTFKFTELFQSYKYFYCAKAQNSMKYRGVRALPASVALWLEQQLEERGIDSIIYTRYILSLLQDDSFDINDLPSFSKATKINNWKSCNLEELKRTAVVECLTEATDQAVEIESLVDELCTKLKEVESEDTGNCLKERTNSEDLFNLELPVNSPDLALRYYSAFPALSRETIGFENSLLEKSAWSKNICRALGRRREPENSPKENKITKRKEGKENARGRMRSRSTVKSQSSQRSRSAMAKSLDRSEKGRKCLFGKEEKNSSTIGREEEYEKYLPMDFQSLLQSPENNSQDFFRTKNSQPVSGNFIQCGTNITSSIWSSEKMEEDESVPWEEVGKYVGWSDARNSLLSSAWKLPFVYGNTSSKKEEDIEGTTLNLKNDGAFFSLFNDNSNHLSLLKATNFMEKSDQKKVEPPEQLENLLTSMKTHFKPIKQESVEVNASSYNDGSSFVGANFLEEVKFHRSESGSLFLGPDQKYMEYKRPDLTISPEFIPKFRVCSNEKFCQTDDPPPEEDSSLDQNIESEFFFPGDDRYLEDALNDECSPRIEIKGWVTTWPIGPSSSEDIWSNDSRQPWVIGENENWNSSEGIGKREDYTRLRREITQEGEQLLSDLRSINLLQDHRPQNFLLVGSSGM